MATEIQMPAQMTSVFIVQHLHKLPQDEEDVKIIGIYVSRDDAEAAVERARKLPGFCDLPKLVDPEFDDDPQGFYIDEYVLGMDNFDDGYVTV